MARLRSLPEDASLLHVFARFCAPSELLAAGWDAAALKALLPSIPERKPP